MADSNAYVELLLGRGYLADFDRDELKRVVDACQKRIVHSGEALWGVGELRDCAFILLGGKIERSVRLNGNRRTDTYFETGRILSISALVHDWEYHSSAVATERTEVLVLTRDAFEAMFNQGDSAAYKLVDQVAAYLVRDMRRANARLQEVFGQPAETLRMLKRRIREDSKA